MFYRQLTESGDETDYPFNDEQRYQAKFWAWLQSPHNFFSQSCITAGPVEQMPKVKLFESQDAPLAPRATRTLSLRVDALSGDLAVDDMPDTPAEFKEGRQEPLVYSDFRGYDHSVEVEKLNKEDKHKQRAEQVAKSEAAIETEAHFEQMEAKSKFDVNGEHKAEQQEEMHNEGNLEFKAMLGEDLQSWWLREHQLGLLKSLTAASSSPSEEARAAAAANARLGRVILEAHFSCKDEAGIDVALEQRLLRLHLYQPSKDAARCFLEEHNGLAPRVVRRYLQPLSSWLQDRVQADSSEIACEARKVEGDLEQITCWYHSKI